MADLYKIKLPNNNEYDLRDSRLDHMSSLFHVSTKASDTPEGVVWTPSGGSAITGTLAANTDEGKKYIYLVYSPNDDSKDNYDEYVSTNTSGTTWTWEKLGSTSINLDNLKVAFTPAGSVSSTFSGTAATIKAAGTPAGTVSKPTFSGTAATISQNIGYTPAGGVSQPTFSGTAATISVTGTPGAGTYTRPTGSFSGTAATITSKGSNATGTYTRPTGSFSGTAATVTSTASYTPGGSVTVTPKSGSAITYVASASVDGTKLVISTSTFTPVTGATGSFSGTAATITSKGGYTPAGSVTLSGGGYTPGAVTVTSAYTPAGSVTLSGGGYTPGSVTATAAYTPAGTVSKPTFSGTAATIAVKAPYTPAGTVSQPTFSGTAATYSASYTPAGSVSSTFAGTPTTVNVTH